MNIFYTSATIAQLPVLSKKPTASEQTDKEKNSSELFPQEQLYPVYLANPLRSTFSLQRMYVDKSSIAYTSLQRFDLKIGGRLGIYRKKSSQREWQITMVAGFHGQFDREQYDDNVGWDGLYAVSIDVRENKHLAWRFGAHHTSSHIGDELAERTGRTRINYTRQELRAGAMWLVTPFWQTYAEIGWAYETNNKDLQKLWRTELGLQYEKRHIFFDTAGFYAALDLSSYEENNWDINTAVQFGLIFANDERNWRFGIEIYDGRVQLGEFFQDNEKYIGLGIRIDV